MKVSALIKRSIEIYPKSATMRRQWVKHTYQLLKTNKHGLITGGWKNGATHG